MAHKQSVNYGGMRTTQNFTSGWMKNKKRFGHIELRTEKSNCLMEYPGLVILKYLRVYPL